MSLGWENDWERTPALVSACYAQGHSPGRCYENADRTVESVWCEECGYKYKVDSSD